MVTKNRKILDALTPESAEQSQQVVKQPENHAKAVADWKKSGSPGFISEEPVAVFFGRNFNGKILASANG